MILSIPPEVQNFWAPVSQIVPVVSLALVIETRLIAKRWDVEHVWIRRSQSLALFVAAFLLLQVESTALNRMRSGTHDQLQADLVTLFLIIAMAVVTLLPVQVLSNAANIDLFQLVHRWTPGSAWRANVKQMKAGAARLNRLLSGFRSNLDTAESQLRAVDELIERKREQIDELTIVLEFAKTASVPNVKEVIRATKELLERVHEDLAQCKAVRVEAESSVRLGVENLQEALEMAEEFERVQADQRIGTQSPEEKEHMRKVLARVAQSSGA